MTREELTRRICPNFMYSNCENQEDCNYCKGKMNIWLNEYDKQIRAEAIDEIYNKIDEGVCDICEHKDFEADCFKTCNFEVENAKKWLLGLKEQNK